MNKNYKAPHRFCDLPDKYSSWEKSRIVIQPVAYDLTTSYKSGTNLGPKAIIEASRYMETYDEETGKEAYKSGMYTAEEIIPDSPAPEDVIARLETRVGDCLKAGKFPVILGGEHSISLGAVRALKKKNKDFCVLHLDAHRDLRDTFHGTKYSHACIARRILELVPVTQAGIRSLSKEEALYKGINLKTIFMTDIIEDKKWIGNVISKIPSNKVYVTIDLDVLDPAIMPSVGTPEPGGIGWYELLSLLKAIKTAKKIIGFDVVELSPVPGNVAPDFLAAKLVYKLLTYIFNT